MNARIRIIKMVVLGLALPFALLGAPYNYNGNNSSSYSRQSQPQDNQGAALQQIKTNLSDLKHSFNNHDAELRTLESQLNNHENLIENLRQQLTQNTQAQSDLSNAQNANLEGKIDALDNTVKGLIADLRQIKTQANESVAILAQYKQKLSDFEKLIEAQNQHMRTLENGLQAMVELFQAKSEPPPSISGGSYKTYKVQPGDSLEKIARAQKVSVQSIRDSNGLKQDRIVVGQTIKIPN